MNMHISEVGQVIQLAIAPVFLLAAVGTMLVVLTNRLARITDRTRAIKLGIKNGQDDELADELGILTRRSYLINHALWLCTICGLLICIVIAALFLGATTALPLDECIAACFVIGMAALSGGFGYFLAEVTIACRDIHAQQAQALAS